LVLQRFFPPRKPATAHHHRRFGAAMSGSHGHCASCGKHDFLRPLHGDKGGPPYCLTCLGKWHAEHGKRRKWGRIVVRAMQAYFDAGGKYDDIDKLKLATGGFDPLGYGTDLIAGEEAEADLTAELLNDALSLTHPDKHPPERRELATRVTAGLVALKPFAFPAPKPVKQLKPSRKKKTAPTLESDDIKLTAPSYPCADCADAVPVDYCDACRAEYERRAQEDFDKRTAKQRETYAKRRQELIAARPASICACGRKIESKRADARYCSARCRQEAHRKPVTDKSSTNTVHSFSRDRVERAILDLLDRHRAIYLNDLLPANRTRAQYQALSLLAAQLEDDGKIDSFSYLVRWHYP